MSAPNDFGSNQQKSIVLMPIDATGTPISPDNPLPVEIILDGQPVSASNPLPIISV